MRGVGTTRPLLGEAPGRPRSLRSGRPHRCQPRCLLLGAHRSAQHVIGRTDESISLVLLTGVPADWPSSLGLLVVCLLEKYCSLQSWVILRHPPSCCLFALPPVAGGSPARPRASENSWDVASNGALGPLGTVVRGPVLASGPSSLSLCFQSDDPGGRFLLSCIFH